MADTPAQRSPLILFAMKEEMAPLRRLCAQKGWQWRRAGQQRFSMSKEAQAFDVVVSGPGRLNVEEALGGLRPAAIIHPGFAGSISPGLGLGDLAQISRARWGPTILEVEAPYLHLPEIQYASIVTAPAPLDASDKQTMLADRAGDLVDMETFHVLKFCQTRGIPYSGLRAVSDGLNDELPKIIKDSYDGRRFQLGKIIKSAIFSNKSRGELLKLRRNSILAGDLLARALFKALAGS